MGEHTKEKPLGGHPAPPVTCDLNTGLETHLKPQDSSGLRLRFMGFQQNSALTQTFLPPPAETNLLF